LVGVRRRGGGDESKASRSVDTRNGRVKLCCAHRERHKEHTYTECVRRLRNFGGTAVFAQPP
jgi:hypothetical protein